MQYIRAALSLLAATKHSLIYMIIGGCGARRDKGETQNNAKQSQEGRANRDVICSTNRRGTIKQEADIRFYVRRNSESDGPTMKLSTTKCRQLPIVRGDICGVDTDAEKEMKSEEQKGMTVFTAAASRCKWSMIADLEHFERITELSFNVYCMFEQTWLAMQSKKTPIWRHGRCFHLLRLKVE